MELFGGGEVRSEKLKAKIIGNSSERDQSTIPANRNGRFEQTHLSISSLFRAFGQNGKNLTAIRNEQTLKIDVAVFVMR